MSLASTFAPSAGRLTRRTETFPFVAISTTPNSLPVEVSLVARLGHGAGTKLFYQALARQRQHGRFADELDEPSAKLGGSDFSKGDATALYSFGVGHGGHPFHRHAGHRVFTAVSGSGGAQLRFSSASPSEVDADPDSFIRALRHVNVPPDCIFTVRFSGECWHQFAPIEPGSRHPAFFALSTHTNELGGDLSDELRTRVLEDKGDIPSLTQVLPKAVVELLSALEMQRQRIPTTTLSLDDAPGGILEIACKCFRSAAGHLRSWLQRRQIPKGFISEDRLGRVSEHRDLPVHSLLHSELAGHHIDHQDRFSITVPQCAFESSASTDADVILTDLLASFLQHRHDGVSKLMAFRNKLVRPFKLRTSPLACPVSSLASPSQACVYANRFPVHCFALSADRGIAQVILGADDKHLVFRTCVEVHFRPIGEVDISLSTRVACKNLFGRLYMAFISAAHRKYIMPRLLTVAVDGMLINLTTRS